MTVIRKYTYDSLMEQVARGRERVGIPVGPNTVAYVSDDTSFFDVILYGNRIAVLYSDGRVKIERGGFTTGTTRARMNDALEALGWRIAVRKTGWRVVTTTPPYRSMEFIDGMVLTPTYQKED